MHARIEKLMSMRDDESDPDLQPAAQARPNVLFELGSGVCSEPAKERVPSNSAGQPGEASGPDGSYMERPFACESSSH